MIYAGIHTYENKDVAERQKAAITEYAEKNTSKSTNGSCMTGQIAG